MNRPMVDITESHIQTAQEIGFTSDASTSSELGFGATFQNRWIQGNWTAEFIKEFEPSIKYLELFALCAGLLTWKEEAVFKDNTVRLHCDNMAVVHMINSLTSSCKNCMFSLRIIVLTGLKYNCRFMAVYIDTKSNFLLDTLSRGQMTRFRKLGLHMNENSDEIAEEIWPVRKIWLR